MGEPEGMGSQFMLNQRQSAKHRYRPKPGRRNAQQLANAEVGASNSETDSDDG